MSTLCGKILVLLHNIFSGQETFLYSELIATGFYKEGDYLFGKLAEDVLPADFDDSELFNEIGDIWPKEGG